MASVRRRRRELALLKTLGFVRRQLASAVAWQSSIAVAMGVVVGVPVGILLGRTLWNLFAHEIDAVPMPSVPGLVIVFIVARRAGARQRRGQRAGEDGGPNVDGARLARGVGRAYWSAR